MDYSKIVHDASNLLFTVACLVFGVNIIVEVVKRLFPKIPTTFLATLVSVVITVMAYFAWASYRGIPIIWYDAVAALILGLFVAYAAMFGFDKFKQALDKLKDYKG